MVNQSEPQRIDHDYKLLIDSVPALITIMTAEGAVAYVNQQVLDYFGMSEEELKNWERINTVHPDDLPAVIPRWKKAVETGNPYHVEHRLRRHDGVFRWFTARGLPHRDREGRIVRWYVLLTDIDDRVHSEEKLRRSEADLLEAQRLSRAGNWRHVTGSNTLSASPEVLRIWGLPNVKPSADLDTFFGRIHPEDRTRVMDLYAKAREAKLDFQVEYRLLLDGALLHVHEIGHPVLDASGCVVEYFGTVMDITEQRLATARLESALEEIKHLKDRLQDENLALREEIDHASMFEEIVGTSAPLRAVIANVGRVAPTDATVLITGETGTGKELVARAIHRRSGRSEHGFIAVNCAAIPPALMASELFGHEKGAFTGALEQRRGRFELANHGTIFLDEVAEMPSEAQTALLRVIQERCLDRVGGNRTVPVDVRVIAATNRDLSAAVSAGTFRQDLFYRLNVFPIEMPPLRNRKDDIPLLVEYFVRRFSDSLGKRVHRIDRRTLDLFRRYSWPGNIRELQNIIERSLILCNGDVFSVDEAWLSLQGPAASIASPLTSLKDQEREIIVSAMAHCRGKVAGADGAAARLGIPVSTLESKIRKFGIDRRKFLGAP